MILDSVARADALWDSIIMSLISIANLYSPIPSFYDVSIANLYYPTPSFYDAFILVLV